MTKRFIKSTTFHVHNMLTCIACRKEGGRGKGDSNGGGKKEERGTVAQSVANWESAVTTQDGQRARESDVLMTSGWVGGGEGRGGGSRRLGAES